MFIQVSEETATNVINDLETRMAEADRTIEAQRADHHRLRTTLYATQDQLTDMTNKLQHEARIACTANHYQTYGKIPMIKALRTLYPYIMGDPNAILGLKEAKDAVDAAMAEGKLQGV